MDVIEARNRTLTNNVELREVKHIIRTRRALSVGKLFEVRKAKQKLSSAVQYAQTRNGSFDCFPLKGLSIKLLFRKTNMSIRRNGCHRGTKSHTN